MRLTVVGSSPAWPNPGGAHAGYLVEGPGRLLLDCGPGVLARLREKPDGTAVAAVAITHLHLDHWGDLVPWAWLSGHGLGPAERPELWLPPGGLRGLAAFAERFGHPGMFELAFRPREYEPERPFAAAGFRVHPIAVEHYGVPAYGFRVADESGRVLGYSGDTGPCEGLERIAAGAALLLCEATLASGADDAVPRGHLAADEALAVADGRVLLTHRPVELAVPEGAARAVDGATLDIS